MKDVFERIEERIIAIGEFLERARRYRPLAAEADRLYWASTRLSSRVRRAHRDARASDAETLEGELAALLEAGETVLAKFLASAPYRGLLEAIAAGESGEIARRVVEIFADIEPATALDFLYFPLTAKHGEGILEPEAGIEMIRRISGAGFEPSRGPGVGGDDRVHPIRLYEGSVGIDAAVLLAVAGDAIPAPAMRAPEAGEILVYAPRLVAPFEVALRRQSPDDWLEVRPGGYAEYHARWRDLLEKDGFPIREI